MAVCVKCKERISDGDKFCPKCGHKREKCSCGAFIDYKPHYCAECGRMTHYGLSFLQAQLEDKKLELNTRKERLENLKQQLQEGKEQLEERKLIYEGKIAKIAKELVKETGLSLDELKNNFVDKEKYIELNHPIGNIHRISKTVRMVYSFSDIFNSRSFDEGFRLPNIEELKIIYKIKAFCKIETLKIDEWCCSSSVYNNSGEEVKYQTINRFYSPYGHVDSTNISGVWCLNFCNGKTVKEDRNNNSWQNNGLKFFGIN